MLLTPPPSPETIHPSTLVRKLPEEPVEYILKDHIKEKSSNSETSEMLADVQEWLQGEEPALLESAIPEELQIIHEKPKEAEPAEVVKEMPTVVDVNEHQEIYDDLEVEAKDQDVYEDPEFDQLKEAPVSPILEFEEPPIDYPILEQPVEGVSFLVLKHNND